ncbi:uncharacterized protein LOC108597263 [Drosophila busckii]|uniref:uncharacterized protein LOC108597263 n=1 Tax=Drosophila busckii TaxID=30019 RepID=UPI00083EF96B|nr:uncharacterized protein LOC108597263 [Drosophila busckii]
MSLHVASEMQWLHSVLPQILRSGRLLDNYEETQLSSFKVLSIDVEPIGIDEAYMMTLCYRASIRFEYAGQLALKKMIVKKSPVLPPDMYNKLQFDVMFYNEISFYTEILPMIQQLAQGNFAAPKYYHSERQAQAALIVLEDFGTAGWRITEDRYGLSLEHAVIAVKYLGKFHGFGYAIKQQQPQRFALLCSKLKESRFNRSELPAAWQLKHEAIHKRMLQSVFKHQPQLDKKFIEHFYVLTSDYLSYGRQRVAPREPLATLCHGDYLRNNVAYKYNELGEPLDIMMFDYQTMRLCSPMVDLCVFLSLSILADVRYAHFDALFDAYGDALFASYKQHAQQSLPAYLNRETLLKEYVRHLPYAITIASFFLAEMVEPRKEALEELVSDMTDQQIIEQAMTKGGELVDQEVAHQLKELYELCQKHHVHIADDIDMSTWADKALNDYCYLIK